MDNYALCEALLRAESEEEVEAALRDANYFDDNVCLAAFWRVRYES